jgi:hypothetical protein
VETETVAQFSVPGVCVERKQHRLQSDHEIEDCVDGIAASVPEVEPV